MKETRGRQRHVFTKVGERGVGSEHVEVHVAVYSCMSIIMTI